MNVETKTAVTETLFDQKRRLRSEEIHYLDHPLFGVIVQIRKIPADELAVLNAESEARAQRKRKRFQLLNKQSSSQPIKKEAYRFLFCVLNH